MASQVVNLNVGGTKYTTTRQTLCRYPNSMLGAMFGGSMPSTQDEKGRYFIDRNGHMFIYVLDFLRSSQLILPDDFHHIDQLLAEADFYQLEPLISVVRNIKEKREIKSAEKGHILEVIAEQRQDFCQYQGESVTTTLYGRGDVINGLPSQFFADGPRLAHKNSTDFVKVRLNGNEVRLELATYLQSQGWRQLGSELSSSSCYDTNYCEVITKHSYRDRWFLPTHGGT